MKTFLSNIGALLLALAIIALVALLQAGFYAIEDELMEFTFVIPEKHPTQETDNPINYICINGYMYFDIDGKQIPASRTLPNKCIEEQ